MPQYVEYEAGTGEVGLVAERVASRGRKYVRRHGEVVDQQDRQALVGHAGNGAANE